MGKRETETEPRTVEPRTLVRVPRVPCVRVHYGTSQPRLVRLDMGTVRVGRAEDLEVQIDDESLSRRHVEFVVGDEGVVRVFDLESTNGTYVNGKKVDNSVLEDGDLIQIGPEVELTFHLRSVEEIDAAAESLLRPREIEVALLVAKGLSNAEIASKLHISTRTVTTHMTNIYQRLGLTSRAALTRYVVEREGGLGS